MTKIPPKPKKLPDENTPKPLKWPKYIPKPQKMTTNNLKPLKFQKYPETYKTTKIVLNL